MSPNTYPRLVIFEERHVNRYYLATNDQEYAMIFAKVLRERWDEGHWYEEPSKNLLEAFTEEEKAYLLLPEELLPHLPAFLQGKYGEAQKRLASLREEQRQEAALYGALTQVALASNLEEAASLTTKRGDSLAWRALRLRAEREYEGFREETIEPLQDPRGQDLQKLYIR